MCPPRRLHGTDDLPATQEEHDNGHDKHETACHNGLPVRAKDAGEVKGCAGARTGNTVELLPSPFLERDNIVRTKAEHDQRGFDVPCDTIIEAVGATVDLARNHLDIALIGAPVELPRVPIPEKRGQSFPRIGVDQVRVLVEIRRPGIDVPASPDRKLLLVELTSELEWSSASTQLAVPVDLRRVAEIRSDVVTLLGRRRPQICRSYLNAPLSSKA